MTSRYNCEKIIETKVTNEQDHTMIGYFVVFVAIAVIVYSMTSDATITKVFAFLKRYSIFSWIIAATVVFGLIISSIISVTELKTETKKKKKK